MYIWRCGSSYTDMRIEPGSDAYFHHVLHFRHTKAQPSSSGEYDKESEGDSLPLLMRLIDDSEKKRQSVGLANILRNTANANENTIVLKLMLHVHFS